MFYMGLFPSQAGEDALLDKYANIDIINVIFSKELIEIVQLAEPTFVAVVFYSQFSAEYKLYNYSGICLFFAAMGPGF